ncbi:MAG: hypothetical protein IPF74_15900 [Rhodocyclaceae bacterium]|nr:hypothetical protein [Rhodocyclaceae bacterium]
MISTALGSADVPRLPILPSAAIWPEACRIVLSVLRGRSATNLALDPSITTQQPA